MRYFELSEFECPCCKKADMDSVLLGKLDHLRENFGQPLTINSGFRCKKHNAKLKESSPNSQHLLGKAADLSIVGMSSEEKHKLVSLAFESGFKGIGIGKTFIHVDVRSGKPSLWGY